MKQIKDFRPIGQWTGMINSSSILCTSIILISLTAQAQAGLLSSWHVLTKACRETKTTQASINNRLTEANHINELKLKECKEKIDQLTALNHDLGVLNRAGSYDAQKIREHGAALRAMQACQTEQKAIQETVNSLIAESTAATSRLNTACGLN